MLLSADRAETAYEAHRRRVGANNRVWRSPGPPFRPGVFSKHGAEVVLWDINGQTNEETAKLVRAQEGQAHAYTVDVTNRNKCTEQPTRYGRRWEEM